MPRVQRCPKHTRRKPRKTGVCTAYDPPYQTKYIRCPNGERKNPSTRICERYIPTEPKWNRCPNGHRKNAKGNCIRINKKKLPNSESISSDKLDSEFKKKLLKQVKDNIDKKFKKELKDLLGSSNVTNKDESSTKQISVKSKSITSKL